MADPAKDVTWTSTKGALDQYLQLLESGIMSDTQVHCGKSIWKVHKAILCVRSQWFKKALTGPFKEAENGIINITEFQENEVDCLLHFIYTGSVDVGKSFTTPVGLYACMSIWRMGDFFLLEELCKFALDELDGTFRRVSWSLTSNQTDSAKQSATIKIVKLVRALYKQDRSNVGDAFKPTIMAFLVSGIRILEKNKPFTDLLFEIPTFASDWAAILTDNMTNIGVTYRPQSCAKCNQRDHSNAALGKWTTGQKVEGFCGQCFPLQLLEDWIGGDSVNT